MFGFDHNKNRRGGIGCVERWPSDLWHPVWNRTGSKEKGPDASTKGPDLSRLRGFESHSLRFALVAQLYRAAHSYGQVVG